MIAYPKGIIDWSFNGGILYVTNISSLYKLYILQGMTGANRIPLCATWSTKLRLSCFWATCPRASPLCRRLSQGGPPSATAGSGSTDRQIVDVKVVLLATFARGCQHARSSFHLIRSHILNYLKYVGKYTYSIKILDFSPVLLIYLLWW